MPCHAKFMQPFLDDFFQCLLAAGEQHDKHLPLVANIAIAADIAAGRKAVNQTYNAVMPQVEAVR